MNQKKKSQEKNKFSKLRLHSSSNQSNKFCSPRPQEKISSYFSSVNEITPNLEITHKNAPDTIITKLSSKNSTQTITTKTSSELNADIGTSSDISDFTKPKIINATRRLENKSSHSENVTKRKSKYLSKPKEDNFISDTNQEHLQLAIAMSKSILELENPQEAESVENTFPSTQQKIVKVKQTLDQFGFKSGKCPTLTNSKTNVKLTKGKKFKYCTPTLVLRTEEDRTKLIENKVSQIINNISIYNNTIQENKSDITNKVDNKPRSFILRDYYSENPVLFNKNSSCPSVQESIFYNGIIQPSNVQVGVLLKDWLTIPGREATPPLKENKTPKKIENESTNILQVPITSIEISMSPELFTDSDNDDKMEHNGTINNSRKAFVNSTESITQINKNTIIESNGSTNSVSLLDNIKGIKNTSIIHMSTSLTKSTDLSLSPFPDIGKCTNNKQIKLQHNFQDNNNENSDSLSPFECVNVEVNKSPKKKVTPKKNSPSPKKYVVTPTGRKIISSNNKKKHSPCKRSILFTNKQDIGTSRNDSSNKTNEICHFESFCNDSIECFDLTHSSDDEVLNLDKNDNTTNKSYTITQLINELSPVKCKLNNEDTKEVQSYDSQASIETMKLNISKCADTDLNEEYSPEFDCLNISNNKVFYETLNDSLIPNNDDGMKDNLIENHSQDEIDSLNSVVVECERSPSEIHKNGENIEENTLKPLLNDEMKYSFRSPDSKVNNKSNNLISRSHSENFIDNNIIQNESTPLRKCFRLSTASRKLSQSANEIERSASDLNVSITESNDNIFLSRSSISTCSDISDEELNYSCNSIYNRYNLSDKIISISDEEDDGENETASKCNLDVHESLLNNSNLCSINKSLQHPRISKLTTPIKVMKSANLINREEKGLLGENMITTNTSNIGTPKTDFIINTDNITPKGHYSDMDTPERNRELEKFGLKPMKRNKGVKLLNYIYDSTHPYVNDSNNRKILNSSSEDENVKVKKRKKSTNNEISSLDSMQKILFERREQSVNQIAESEKLEDMVFERKQSTKISSCRLPLHVAWHNLLVNSKELQETILTYTPLQVEEVYEQLKEFGYKFHVQDIIAFLDKKCITIRIAQNSRQKKVNNIK